MKKSEILKIVGSRIKEIRESKGITQVELAVKMEENFGKFDVTNISRIENGRTNPTVFNLYRIAEAMEIHVKELLTIELEN